MFIRAGYQYSILLASSNKGYIDVYVQEEGLPGSIMFIVLYCGGCEHSNSNADKLFKSTPESASDHNNNKVYKMELDKTATSVVLVAR